MTNDKESIAKVRISKNSNKRTSISVPPELYGQVCSECDNVSAWFVQRGFDFFKEKNNDDSDIVANLQEQLRMANGREMMLHKRLGDLEKINTIHSISIMQDMGLMKTNVGNVVKLIGDVGEKVIAIEGNVVEAVDKVVKTEEHVVGIREEPRSLKERLVGIFS